MTPAQQAEYDAYLLCANKAGQKAAETERAGCFGYARPLRDLEGSIKSIASSFRTSAGNGEPLQTSVDQAKAAAYMRCASKACQRAERLESGSSGKRQHARPLRELEKSFEDLAASLRITPADARAASAPSNFDF